MMLIDDDGVIIRVGTGSTEYESKDKAVCPHCKQFVDMSEYNVGEYNEDSSFEVESYCPNCKKEFLVYAERCVIYTTETD